jgi:hypothetical protein
VRPIPNLDQALWVMPCDSNNPAADIPIISANMDAHEAVPTSDLCRQPPPRSCGSATTFGWPITPPCTAVESCRLVLPLLILDDTAPGPWAPGGASRWWLHHSLDALRQSLAEPWR